MNIFANKRINVDCLQYSKPSRERFLEWKKGNINVVHVTLAVWENALETIKVISEWNKLFRENSDLIDLAKSQHDILEIVANKKTAIIFGFQNTSPFEDDIELIEIFHQMGVRISQLTYNIRNLVATGCWEDEGGISGFLGKNFIKEMDRVGMIIDLSHCNERSSIEAMELSQKPVVFTHANPSGYVGFDIELNKRNKSDELLKLLASQGGVIGLSMYPKILKNGSKATINDFCDMVAYTVDLIGIDHVGIGSDFYTGYTEEAVLWWRAGRWSRESPLNSPNKFSKWPTWFNNPSQFQNLELALERKGFNSDEVSKIIGQNWLNLFSKFF